MLYTKARFLSLLNPFIARFTLIIVESLLVRLFEHPYVLSSSKPPTPDHSFFILCSSKCSIRALKRERDFLAKRVSTRLSSEERESLYIKWGVSLEGKQRRLQFVSKLWTEPHDPVHVHESAEIVAKLVGFCESGKASREMFELNFALPTDKRPWTAGWNHISNLLHL